MDPRQVLNWSRAATAGVNPPMMCPLRPALPPRWFNNAEDIDRQSVPYDDVPSTDHYDMAGSGTYTNPQELNGMAPSTSSSSSGRNPDGTALSPSSASRAAAETALLKSSRQKPLSDLQADCERLEKSNRRMKTIFYLLLTLCVLVVLVYLCVVIALFMVLAGTKMDHPDQSTRFSESRGFDAGSHGREKTDMDPSGLKNCVHKDQMMEFKNIWGPEDQRDLMDILESADIAGFDFSSRTGLICFDSLQWVPQIMGKINSRVQDSVSYIEDQQEKINQTVNLYTSANNTRGPCSPSGKPAPFKRDPTDPRYSVYAHFFLDIDVSYSESVGDVRWINEGQKLSSRNRVDVFSQSGKFAIKESGFYFIYTHLVFKEGLRDNVHRVVKTRNGQRTKRLESAHGPASFLQGVFRLRANDNLTVEATTQALDKSRDKVSYFGVYLIRA